MTTMHIRHPGDIPSAQGNPDHFTGKVRLDPLVASEMTGRVSSALVTFEPGARTHWHTHPAGQTLIVTAGAGLAQEEGGPVVPLRPGDTVWFEPGVRHWHGAASDTGMSHIAIQEVEGGSAVTWLEAVADADYTG